MRTKDAFVGVNAADDDDGKKDEEMNNLYSCV